MTNDAAGEHNQIAASAISRGVAMRPIGCSATTCAMFSAESPSHSSTMRVRAVPGQIALMRTPCDPNSRAAVFVSPITPCFAAT